MLLAGDAQPFRLRAGGDDQRVAGVVGAGIALQPERPHVEIDLGDDVADDLGADMLGLLQHLLHQPRTLDRIGEARIVLDVGGDHQLAALLQAGDQHRLQHGARRVDRRRVAGRAGADDEDWCVLWRSYRSLSAGPNSTAGRLWKPEFRCSAIAACKARRWLVPRKLRVPADRRPPALHLASGIPIGDRQPARRCRRGRP